MNFYEKFIYKKIKYILIKVAPKNLSIKRFSKKRKINIKLKLKERGLNILKSPFVKTNKFKKLVTPPTKTILIIFEPITFPITKSNSFFIAEFIDTNNSGIDVPRATRVNPIIELLTPILIAIPIAPSRNKFEPKDKRIAPKDIKTKIFIPESYKFKFSDSLLYEKYCVITYIYTIKHTNRTKPLIRFNCQLEIK